MRKPIYGNSLWLITGDIIVFLIVTLIGFIQHATLTTAGWRILATFIPLVAAWLIVSPGFGVFSDAGSQPVRWVLKAVWAALIAVPTAALFRGLWLNSPILPIFVMVLAAASALLMFIWRGLFCYLSSRK
jgi:hypothetical protein